MKYVHIDSNNSLWKDTVLKMGHNGIWTNGSWILKSYIVSQYNIVLQQVIVIHKFFDEVSETQNSENTFQFYLVPLLTMIASVMLLLAHQWNIPVESNLRGSSPCSFFSAAVVQGADGTSDASRSMACRAFLLGLLGLE